MKTIKVTLTLIILSIVIGSTLLTFFPQRTLYALLLISIWGTGAIYFGLEIFHIYTEWSQNPRGNKFLIADHVLLGFFISLIQTIITMILELLILSKIMHKPIDTSNIASAFKFQLGDISSPNKILNDFQIIYTQTHGKILYIIGITSTLILIPLFSAVLVPLLYLLHKKPKKFLYFTSVIIDLLLIAIVILIFNY